MERMARQFGTLGSGNHFAEVCRDDVGQIWVMVHSGSRGAGNLLAQHHITAAQQFVASEGLEVEHRDLSYLVSGTSQFDGYLADLTWAQSYAFYQRQAMANRLVDALSEHVRKHEVLERINCHHNYSEAAPDGDSWLSRKGAINAEAGKPGIIPGSMGAASYSVCGLGNPESHHTSPHGAGRKLSRGRAKRELDLAEFKAQMSDRVWQDRDAEVLLDEAPDAYKPIDVVMSDSTTLVEPVARLQAIINYKGV
jgi:tRNA-splicing ligase RtcB